jgi:hypothetical protein
MTRATFTMFDHGYYVGQAVQIGLSRNVCVVTARTIDTITVRPSRWYERAWWWVRDAARTLREAVA